MKTLTVPTVAVLIAVLVNKDSLEMEQFVKVNESQNVQSSLSTEKVTKL